MAEALPDVSGDVIDGIAAAAESDGLITDPLETSSSAPAPQAETTPEAPASQTGAETQEGATAEADSFTKLDPNSLPADVRPYYDSMLADYTRKTQEAAPWRKIGSELGAEDPTALRQAVDLYAYLQDENNLRDFAQNLSTQLGLGQPEAPAATPTSEAEPTEPQIDDLEDDSPALQALRQELNQIKGQLSERDKAAEQERYHMALIGEATRQENALAQAHPEYEEADWDAIYQVAPAFEGDLFAANNTLENYVSTRIARVLNGKQQVADTVPSPVPVRAAAETPVDISEAAANDPELTGATAEAKEYMRNLLATSE